MLYGRSDVLAWYSSPLLACITNSLVQLFDYFGIPCKAKIPFQKRSGGHESEPMVNEGTFFRGLDTSVDHGHIYYSDDRFTIPVKNSKSGKKRTQAVKNNNQSASTPSHDNEPHQDNVPKNSTPRMSGATASDQKFSGRRHKNHKPRNIAQRNSLHGMKKMRQRSAASEEADAMAKHLEHLREALQKIPFQAIWSFVVSSVLWAVGVIVGLSCLLMKFVWQCVCASYMVAAKWCARFQVWLVKKLPYLRIPKWDHRCSLPKTGEAAVQRLLKCRDSDPYTILGVSPTASDDQIRKSYRSQAVLVHPDKNRSPKAEEAFKILASAFEILGSEEKRAAFDSTFKESEPMDLLETLKKKIEESQNVMGCKSCSGTHNRYPTRRSPFQARYCASCKAHHPAKEGDLWAETSMLGFRWHFYAYLDSAVYDVTEWVRCQKDLLGCMEANTHRAPCRLNIPRGNSFALSRLLEELFGQG